MIKKINLIIVSIVMSINAFADALDTWTYYSVFNEITDIEVIGNEVFVLASGNLYSYNTSDNSLQIYDKSTTLSDNKIKTIVWNKVAKRLIIAYEDSNIDLLSPDGNIINVPDIQITAMAVNKNINSVSVSGKYAFISTGFGIVKMDVTTGAFPETYNLGFNINSTAPVGDYIFAVTEKDEVYKGSVKDNLLNPKSWTFFRKGTQYNYHNLAGKLIGIGEGTVAEIDVISGEEHNLSQHAAGWSKVTDNCVIFGRNGEFNVIDNQLKVHTFTIPNAVVGPVAPGSKTNTFWAKNADNALTLYTFGDDGALASQTTGVKPDSPKSDIYRIAYANKKLYAVPGMNEAMASITRDGEVMVYDGEGWSTFENTVSSITGGRYRNIDFVLPDPKNSNRIIVGGETGLYEFMNGKLSRYWNTSNAPMTSAVPGSSNPANWTIINSATFDKDGNLWVMNSHSPSIMYMTPTGEWKTFNHSDLLGGEISGWIESAVFDNHGNLWFCSTHYYDGRLYCYNVNNDKLVRFDNFANQDGNSFETYYHTIAKDKKGNIWIGTRSGPFYVSDEDIKNGSFTITQHKVPRNDGTNLADYLLSDIDVNCIYVDAANRKWIGTNGFGLYVISNDCNTEVAHFTSENSKLISNEIKHIAIDDETGRVYISTADGLCSYMSDVSEVMGEMNDDNVWAYPNPVTPDYTGTIAIRGLEYGSDVKITTASGQVVNEGICSSGTYLWNGCDKQGRRVASGVYMVCVSTSEGNKGIVTKIAIIR